ncbi:hypothetical protein [Risungbinella massiliensis]|uniref:hypothetical protein n=1 Tax=Risungbinella massiliensis TaxID=1329796 RepID=UPI0005CC465E|nr:hypothetical protein [Risungbinella massiliensis]
MSRFSCLGFQIETEEDVTRLIQAVFKNGTTVENEYSQYAFWKQNSGAAMFVPFDQEGVLDCHPHFIGKGHMSIQLDDVVEYPQISLERKIVAWSCPEEGSEDQQGLYKLCFDLPEYGPTIQYPDTPRETTVQLAAFAEECTCFASENEILENQAAELKLASEAFIPIGLFVEEGGDPSPHALFTGRVLEVAESLNSWTDEPFYHLLVQTIGGTIDVVIAPSLLTGTPIVGGYVQVTCWLSGLLLEESEM